LKIGGISFTETLSLINSKVIPTLKEENNSVVHTAWLSFTGKAESVEYINTKVLSVVEKVMLSSKQFTVSL
jgi:hypothetical protein